MGLKKYACIVFIFIFCASFTLNAIMANEVSKNSSIEIAETSPRQFLDIFSNSQEKSTARSRLVSGYIDNCCATVDEAIALLKKNGFEVTRENSSEKVAQLNKNWDTNGEYDEFIYGSRGPVWTQFWKITTSYKVLLFVAKGKISRVYADVETNMP